MERKLTKSEAWASVTPADLMRSLSRRLSSVILTALPATAIIGGLLVAWPNQYSSDGGNPARLIESETGWSAAIGADFRGKPIGICLGEELVRENPVASRTSDFATRASYEELKAKDEKDKDKDDEQHHAEEGELVSLPR